MKKVLLTDPAYDKTTQVLSSWISQTAAYIDTLVDKRSMQVKGNTVKTAVVDKLLNKHKPALVTFTGHGMDDRLFGHNHEILYDIANDHVNLKDTIVHAIACSSGKELGGVMVDNGVKGFIGFKDEFKFHYIDGTTADPLAGLFLEPTYHVTRSLAEGKTLNDSYIESQKMYANNYKSAAIANADVDVLAHLIHNMSNHVILGDINAQIA